MTDMKGIFDMISTWPYLVMNSFNFMGIYKKGSYGLNPQTSIVDENFRNYFFLLCSRIPKGNPKIVAHQIVSWLLFLA